MVDGLRFELVNILYAIVNKVHCLFSEIPEEFRPQKQLTKRYFLNKMFHFPNFNSYCAIIRSYFVSVFHF